MDSENEQSYHHEVKTRRFVLDNKHKCQILRNHSSTHVSLPASAILFPKLCGLLQNGVEETAELLKAEDSQSNMLKLFFQFRQLQD